MSPLVLVRLGNVTELQGDELVDCLEKALDGTEYDFCAVVHVDRKVYTYFVLLKLKLGEATGEALGRLTENLTGGGLTLQE